MPRDLSTDLRLTNHQSLQFCVMLAYRQNKLTNPFQRKWSTAQICLESASRPTFGDQHLQNQLGNQDITFPSSITAHTSERCYYYGARTKLMNRSKGTLNRSNALWGNTQNGYALITERNWSTQRPKSGLKKRESLSR